MIVRRYSVLLLLCFVFLAPIASAASNVVISQVYGGGGSGTAGTAYTNDYVELFNSGDSPAPIGGLSVQYGSSTGQFGSSSGNIFTVPAGSSLDAGKYLLLKFGIAGAAGASFTGDFTQTTLNMAATGGKVALATTSAALGCGATATPCSLPDARILDVVSYGGSNNGEGGTTVNNGTNLNSTNGAVRKSAGCTDTNNNNADFVVATTATGLVPRTLSSPANICGLVANNPPTITAPANPIATVAQDATPFTVSLTGNDDGGVYVWSATAGLGLSSVSVTSGQGTSNATYRVALQAGFNGTASFTASLSDTVNPAVTRTVNIAVTAIVVNNNPPTISLPANPVTTVAQDAAAFDVSLSGSDDNSTYNWSAVAGTGVSAVSVTGGQGTPSATYRVTLQTGFSGSATFTARLSDNVNAPVSQPVNITVTPAPPPPVDHVVISQIYGGGGNTGATYANDFVELYNPSTVPFDLGGWTVQYGSATGTTWQTQPLGGIILPGEYYLITLASGGLGGALVPQSNVNGDINMSATAGKVALVNGGDPLEGCPVSDPALVDLVGFGSTANCREGATNAPAGSNTTSLFRKNGGFWDTNVNGADFFTGAPNPRRTTPIVEIGPYVLSIDPRRNNTSAPRDASINVTFTEAVVVSGAWFNINCAGTALHNDAAVAGEGRFRVITPNTNFQSGELCTVTIYKDLVHDADLDDSAPNTDTLTANYVWSFTTSTGAAPVYGPEVHLTMGNPSGATDDLFVPNNFLMQKPEYALSYNRDRGTPNWVSWHLSNEWTGSLVRVDTFRPDPAVPRDWYRVLHTDYFGSGFDRGHMVPNADRDKETSIPINQATFLMSNMVPQAPDNNQGPWAAMENDLRTLLGGTVDGKEMYIVAGGAGTGGNPTLLPSGFVNTIGNGHVTVPAQTWKVVLVLSLSGGNDVARVTAATRTIAVIMPNVQGIRSVVWDKNYVVTVDQVEALTGYDFFSELPDAIENSIEAGLNGVNPPGVAHQSVSTSEDMQKAFTLQAVSPNSNPLTYTVLTQPVHGTLAGSGANQTYTPAPDFNGTDSFQFRVSEGTMSSNTATVTLSVLEVNDEPAAAADSRSTDEDTPLSFAATDLAANDAAGPANESSQTLTVTAVGATADTHGTVSLNGSQVMYAPAANFNGAASFTYQVCDNGISGGLSDSKCASATVSVSVRSVNDAPAASITVPSTSTEGAAVTASVNVTDADAGDTFSYSWTASRNGSPFARGASTSFSFTPDDNGSYVVSVIVTDSGGATGTDSETVTVSNIAPVIASVAGPTAPVQLGSSASISVRYSDLGAADTHTALFVWDDGTTSVGICASGTCMASRTYASAGVYGVAITVSDDDGASASTSFNFVVVFNPNDSKVTGGGWINSPAGAVVANPALTGKATFNVNSKYQKGENTPQGNTKLKTAGMDFNSNSYDWLVVAGLKAQYKGTGTVNGRTGYGFLLTVTDGDTSGGDGTDKFRIRIWELSSGTTVYDNAMGASDDMDLASPQQIGSGSIVIHASN